MSGRSLLLVRPPIRSDECLVDFAARVASSNGLPWIKQIHEGLLDPVACRRMLSPSTAVNLATYEPRMSPGVLLWRGAVFEQKHVLGKGSAVCPLCLDEFGYRPFVWRFWAKVYCTRHSMLLIDRCSRCGKSLACPSAMLRHCKCGFDLRKEASARVDNTSLLAFQTAIDVAFELYVGEPPRESSHPASALLQSAGGLSMLGWARAVAVGETAKSQRGPRPHGVAVRRAHVDRLAHLFRAGESSIVEEARRRWTAARSRSESVELHRRGFDRFMRYCEGAPLTSAVRSLAKRLAGERADMRATSRLAARHLNDGRLLSIGEAAERHGIDRRLLTVLVGDGKIPYTCGVRRGQGQGRLRLLDTRIIAELCEYRLKLLRLHEVAAMLKISVRQANQLRLRQIIRCAWDSKSGALAEIPLEHVVRVTDRLAQLTRSVPPELADTLVPLDGLPATTSERGFAATLRAALLGKEPVYLNPKRSTGLGRWCVSGVRGVVRGMQS